MVRGLARLLLVGLLLACGALLPACERETPAPVVPPEHAVALDAIPAFSGDPFVEIDGNEPSFSEAEHQLAAFEAYAPLDGLGRCGTAFAVVGPETMPTEERGSIGGVKPSGWHLVRYDIVDGAYLFNRCHLIAYRLAGENANERNLITGTRYMNVEGMLPFENLVADYVKETENHVLYRVTPVFQGEELVARGVEMEAFSVEDQGEGVYFHVYCYNNQPGVSIDYATGESRLASEPAGEDGSGTAETYILNTKSKKFHLPGCSGASDMSPSNREEFAGDRQALLDQGYTPCGICKP